MTLWALVTLDVNRRRGRNTNFGADPVIACENFSFTDVFMTRHAEVVHQWGFHMRVIGVPMRTRQATQCARQPR